MPIIYRAIKKLIPLALYLFVILFVIPPSISLLNRAIFVFYALFIFYIMERNLNAQTSDNEAENKTEEAKRAKKWGWNALLIFSLLFFLASRLFMFVRWGETPLGYDTGFYWQFFDLLTKMGGKIGTALTTNHLAYVPWFPFIFLGFSAIPTINFLHIAHQLLTLGAFYFLLRSLPFGKYSFAACVIGLFLFAISINQFMAFWWMFYKQSMAIPFLLLGLGLFLRGSWLAMIFFIAGAAIHIYPAISFVLAFTILILFLIILSIIKKRPIERWVWHLALLGIFAGLFLILLMGKVDIQSHLAFFLRFKGLSTGGRDFEVAQVKGLFLPFSTFRLNTLFYLPFALIGILKIRSWLIKPDNARFLIIPIILGISFILGFFPFLYQNRSLIILDIFVILFAAYPLTVFIHHFSKERLGKLALGCLLIGSVVFTSRIVWNNLPQIYSHETAELKQLRADAPNPIRKIDDYVMATTSLYTPWVYAYTGFQPTIAPGWLTWDKWDLNMWNKFWLGNSDAQRLKLLSVYGNHNIYMFVGERQILHPNLKKFLETNPHITRISPHIWLYSPQIISSAKVDKTL